MAMLKKFIPGDISVVYPLCSFTLPDIYCKVTDIYTHTHISTHKWILVTGQILMSAHTCTHTNTHTYKLLDSYPCLHTHTHVHTTYCIVTDVCTHTYTHTHAYYLFESYWYVHIYINIHTHLHTSYWTVAHAHTHTYTNTYTHTYMWRWLRTMFVFCMFIFCILQHVRCKVLSIPWMPRNV